MISEIILSAFCSAIVKTILKNIFQDPLAAITDDFFASITGNRYKAREARRMFEAFEDKYSKNFGQIIDQASSSVPNERQEFLLSNIEIVFNEYDFSLNNLISKSFDIQKILDDIIKTKFKNKSQYSTAEWNQLKTLLRLSVGFAVEASERTKDFSAKASRETLNQLSILRRELNNFLMDFEKNRRNLQSTHDLESTSIEFDWKSYIRRSYSKINVFGANLDYGAKRYLLKEAYTTLSAVDVDGGERRNIYDFLSCKHILLLGEAGTGKTTFVNWLAVNSAIDSDVLEKTEWKNRIPFLIELRKQAATLSFDTIRSMVSRRIVKEKSSRWVDDIFSSGRAMLLIDGIDEISRERREEVFEWIVDMCERYNVNVVVTSRPSAIYDFVSEVSQFTQYDAVERSYVAYDKYFDDDFFEGFKFIALEPMSVSLTENFISNWHTAVAHNYGWSKKSVQYYSKKLSPLLSASKPLRELSSYPLLCAMLCGLWHNNGMILPKTKNEMYDECCKMLLENRDESRKITHDIGRHLNYQQKLTILEEIAYWMQINSFTSQKKDLIVDKIREKIDFMDSSIKSIGAEKILDFLVERSGVLRNPSSNDIDFIHKTFQEYLAARVIMKKKDYGILTEKAVDYGWHETVLLAMGCAANADADTIITSLLILGKEDKRYYYAAAAWFNIPTELSPEIRSAVESILQEIIPPRSEFESKLLCSAPELIVDFLIYSRLFSEKELKLCINTLINFGTVDSLNVLAGYFDQVDNLTKEFIFHSIQKFSLKDIANSKISNSIFRWARDENAKTVTVTPFLAALSKAASYNITENCDSIILHGIESFKCLQRVETNSNCKWIIYPEDHVACGEVRLSNVKIKSLMLSMTDEHFDLPLLLLLKFGEIAELIFDGVSEYISQNTFALAEIHGLKKIHFIGDEIYFDNLLSEMVGYFSNPITIEFSTPSFLRCYEVIADDLAYVREFIINDKNGTHASKLGESVVDFLKKYSDITLVEELDSNAEAYDDNL